MKTDVALFGCLVTMLSLAPSVGFAGETSGTNGIVLPTTTVIESIKDDRIKTNLAERISSLKNAQKDLDEIKAGIRTGHIEILNNNGLWCAVLKKDTTTRIAIFSAQDPGSLVTHLKKRVWTNPQHDQEVNGAGYEIYFNTNGLMETYMTRDGKQMLTCFPNGHLKRYSLGIDNGQQSIEWDEYGRFRTHASKKQTGKEENSR